MACEATDMDSETSKRSWQIWTRFAHRREKGIGDTRKICAAGISGRGTCEARGEASTREEEREGEGGGGEEERKWRACARERERDRERETETATHRHTRTHTHTQRERETMREGPASLAA
eukprot:5507230-Pleurochrysis_carterae.AAC.1